MKLKSPDAGGVLDSLGLSGKEGWQLRWHRKPYELFKNIAYIFLIWELIFCFFTGIVHYSVARLRGRTATQRSEKGSQKVLGRVLGRVLGKGFSEGF